MNEIMWWFGQNALTALLMFPCVMVACRLFCDRPAVQHLLWLVILLKFVTPPIVAWPLSVAELRSLAWPQEANVEVASVEPLPELPRGVEFVAEPHVGESLRDSQHSASQRDAAKWRRQEAAGTVAGDATSSSAPVAPLVHAAVIALTLLATWLIGAIVCFVVQLRRLWRYARLIRCGEIAPLHLKEEADVPHISKTISANKFRWEVAEFCWSGSACGRRRGHSPSLCFGKLHEDNSEWRKR